MTKSLQFWISGVNNDPCIDILDKVKSIITQNSITFTELEDCRHEYLRLWMSGCFNDHKFPFWTSGVNNDTRINILDKVGLIITQNSITFTELEDCRHEYLRLWMSGVFIDQKFTILNKWSQQWSLYRHSRQSEVNNNSKFYNIYWVRGLQARNLRLWMSGFFNDQSLQFRISGVNNDPCINILDKVKSITTQNSLTFTELENCRHEYLRLWMSGFFNDQSLPFWMIGVKYDTSINILDKVESIKTQNSITLSELEDCRHEYLRLWMSSFFTDQKFTSMNNWCKQWYQ